MKTLDKQIERLRKKNHDDSSTRTPRKEAEADLAKLRLSPRGKRKLKRKLVLGNALLKEIKATGDSASRKEKHPLHNILAGKITKKYRLITAISRGTGLARNSMHTSKSKVFRPRKEVRRCLSEEVEEICIAFMRREDNCRMLPGKVDAKKTEEGTKEQSVVLTDYLRNLHLKFLAENPNLKMSLATFCRLRPKKMFSWQHSSQEMLVSA